MKIHKGYDYNVSSDIKGELEIYSKLRGKMFDVNNELSISGSPYELLIWISTYNSDYSQCELEIRDINLFNSDHNNVIDFRESFNLKFKKKEKGSYVANLLMKNIELKYDDYKISFSFLGKNKCVNKIKEARVEMEFIKNYQERKISFWDTLMGI